MKEWDAVLPVELADEWKKCITTLDRIDEVPIPRSRIPCNFATPDCEFEFHVFADSSKDVAAVAAYLRSCPCSGDQSHSYLVVAKIALFSRHEMAQGSISRKKLIALDIGSRLLKECLDDNALKIRSFDLWSDSQMAIKWCASEILALRVFERNRVDLVLKRTNGKLPRYVPTGENSTDIATLGCRVEHREKWKMWMEGLDFLRLPKTHLQLGSVPEEEERVMTIRADQERKGFMHHTLNRTNSLSKILQVVRKVIECCDKWKGVATNSNDKMKESMERRAHLMLVPHCATRMFREHSSTNGKRLDV